MSLCVMKYPAVLQRPERIVRETNSCKDKQLMWENLLIGQLIVVQSKKIFSVSDKDASVKYITT